MTGRTLAENAAEARPADGTVIRTVADPFGTDPAITVLRGSLAPGGAVAKRPVPDTGQKRFTGPARIFPNREEAIAGITSGRLRPGDVAVIRGIGVSGAPGMGLTSRVHLRAARAGSRSERRSRDRRSVQRPRQPGHDDRRGLARGRTADGPLGRVQDDDIIDIDLAAGTVDLLVSPEELAARAPVRTACRGATRGGGYLDQYRELVQPLECGAVLCARARRQTLRAGARRRHLTRLRRRRPHEHVDRPPPAP